MCRRNRVYGLCAITFGTGLLLSLLISSGFLCCLLGFAGIAAGLAILLKNPM